MLVRAQTGRFELRYYFAVREWMFQQGKDIRGNVRYWLPAIILMVAGSAVAALTRSLRSWQQVALFAIYLPIAIWAAVMTWARPVRTALPSPWPDEPLAIPTPPLTSAPTPKDPDLRGEMLEMIFSTTGALSNPRHIQVLMKLRIVNHGTIEVTVTNWKLEIKFGPKYPQATAFAAIPPTSVVIDRSSVDKPVEQIRTSLDQQAHTHPLKQGVPMTGWILFELGVLFEHTEPPVNAQFTVTAFDALGGSHRIVSGVV